MHSWDYHHAPESPLDYALRLQAMRPGAAMLQRQQIVAPYHRPVAPHANNSIDTWRANEGTWRSPQVGPPLPRMAQVHEYWRPQQSAAPRQQLWKDFNAPSRPAEITFLQRKSATQCTVRFQMPDLPYNEIAKRTIKVHEKDEHGPLIESANLKSRDMEWTFKTTPGACYAISLTVKNKRGRVVAHGYCQIRATFNIHEMKQLFQRAKSFCTRIGVTMHPFQVVYRCKPQIYWDDVQTRSRGIMHKYIKDDNGQAANPINGSIHGLFFSARLMPDGSLPPTSPFGNVRMRIPAPVLLDPRRVHMYFCDFYCNKVTHYVTIVLCAKDTDIDRYCSERLLPLPFDNPFLRTVHTMVGIEFYVNRKVWVEIYYTDNVPLEWGRFDYIRTTGLGTSKIGGIPHNKYCQECNLYPIQHAKDAPAPELSTYEDECDEAQQHLNTLISKLDSFNLPREDCEEVVFLLSNLVDQVAYETDVCVPNQNLSTPKKHTSLSENNALSVLETLDRSANPSTKTARQKIRSMHENVIQKYDRVHKAIMKKKNKLVSHFTRHLTD